MTLGSLARALIGAPFRESREGYHSGAAADPSGITIAASLAADFPLRRLLSGGRDTLSEREPRAGWPEAPGKPPPSGPGAGVDLRERLDQMGTILAKELDLAEADVASA